MANYDRLDIHDSELACFSLSPLTPDQRLSVGSGQLPLQKNHLQLRRRWARVRGRPWPRVTLGVAVGVALGLTLGVTVGVDVGVALGVIVGVAVGVGVGVAPAGASVCARTRRWRVRRRSPR